MMDVFKAFPLAIVSGIWTLGRLERSTETGAIFHGVGYKDIIVDDEMTGLTDRSPSADGINTDMLIYARPDQMPTQNCASYISDYLWYNDIFEQYYRIVEVGLGKNQETGSVEHYEFRVRPSSIAEVVNE